MSIKKPVPRIATAEGRRCPVCGAATYSSGGIHPQCALARADAKLKIKKPKTR